MKRIFVVCALAAATTFVASANASAQVHRVPKGDFAGVSQVHRYGQGNGLRSYDNHYLGTDPDSRIRSQLLRDPPGNYYGQPQIR